MGQLSMEKLTWWLDLLAILSVTYSLPVRSQKMIKCSSCSGVAQWKNLTFSCQNSITFDRDVRFWWDFFKMQIISVAFRQTMTCRNWTSLSKVIEFWPKKVKFSHCGRPTQIGLWASLVNNSQKYMTKTEQNTQNSWKSRCW
jgi:hypothetical protein